MENPISYAKHHKYIMGGLAIAVILVTAVGSRLLGRKAAPPAGNQITKVRLVEAKDYMRDRGQISANGTVESLEQAELRSQASAPVSKIFVQIGQKVGIGQTLVTLKNNDIAAQLTQAQGMLKAAQARLEEMKKGVRSEQVDLIRARVEAAKQSLADTISQQDVLVKNALSTMLNAGLAAEPNVSNIGSENPVITGTYTGEGQGEYKITVYATGEGLRFQYAGLENSSGLVNTAATPLGTRGLFIQFPSRTVPTSNTWTVSIPNKQAASFNAASSGYQAAQEMRQTAINGVTSALTAAEGELNLALAGATNEQIKGQEAAVDQASGGVAAAAAQYDKTIIRSPISGVVADLPVKFGELVSPGALVVSVVNKGGMQIKAFISDYDLPYVEEGAAVSINGTATGTLARLSPSINPQTKNVEIQVVVGDPDNSGLVVGQNAALKISARQSGNSGPVFLLPLQAVNITNSGAFVYTVRQDSTIEQRGVSLGAVAGEKVEVKEGLEPNIKIVSTVYELKDGQKVTVE